MGGVAGRVTGPGLGLTARVRAGSQREILELVWFGATTARVRL